MGGGGPPTPPGPDPIEGPGSSLTYRQHGFKPTGSPDLQPPTSQKLLQLARYSLLEKPQGLHIYRPQAPTLAQPASPSLLRKS